MEPETPRWRVTAPPMPQSATGNMPGTLLDVLSHALDCIQISNTLNTGTISKMRLRIR